MMKKLLSLILACMMVTLALVGCASTATTDTAAKVKVGLAMPTKEQPIWIAQGERLTEAFEAAGYEVVIEYAEDVAERGMAVELQCAVGDGMPASVAMAAASFAGRRCLGLPSWEEGAPADFVTYREDPEADIAVVAHPVAVCIDWVRF